MQRDISVVMSVYNGEKYLKEAIDSILAQTYANFEFIIIDDGSSDTSNKIIKSYDDSRIILVEQKNTGLAIALNNGIRLSTAPFIARMDADDIAELSRLELQLDFLKNNPEYILVGSNAIVIDKEGEYVLTSDLPIKWDEINKKFPDTSFYHSSVMYCKNAYTKAGRYFEPASKVYSFEDSILWNRMKEFGKMANIEKPLIKYRLLPNAATTKSGNHGQYVNEIINEIVKTNRLSSLNQDRLLKIKGSLSFSEKERLYYLHLAKKFLFNNYQPKKVRSNIRKTIKFNYYKVYPYIIFVLSFLPRVVIEFLYKKIKI